MSTPAPSTRRLGQFKLLRQLGGGDRSLGYRAHDTVLPRPVALKVLRPERARAGRRRAEFLNEARRVAAPSHRKVGTVWTVGEEHGLPLVANDFVEGEALVQRISRVGRLPVTAALVALVGVAWWMKEGGKASLDRGTLQSTIVTEVTAVPTFSDLQPTAPASLVSTLDDRPTDSATGVSTFDTLPPPPTATPVPTAPPPSRLPTFAATPKPSPGGVATNGQYEDPEPESGKTAPKPGDTKPTDPPPPAPSDGSQGEPSGIYDVLRERIPIGVSSHRVSPASDHRETLLPAYSGSVRSAGSQEGDFAKRGQTIDSNLDPADGYALGLLQFNFAGLPQRWIEEASLELVLSKKRNARDTSAWKWTIDVLEPAIHEKAWEVTRWRTFSLAATVKSTPIVLRYSDIQRGIRSASVFEKCEAVQAMNSALANSGGAALVGLRIRASGNNASAAWHSGLAAEPTLWPQLALELGPEGGPTPTRCPVGTTPSAPPPTVSQLSATPTVFTSPSPFESGTPVAATKTATRLPWETDLPSPGATSTESIALTATTTPRATASPRPRPIYLPLVIKATKILPYALNMVRRPDPAMGPGASVLPALATCEDAQSSEAYGFVSIGADLYRSQDGELWTLVNDLDDLSITDLAITSNCSRVLVAKWGGGVYSGRPEANSLQGPPSSSPPMHKYPFALAADSGRVVYGATLANNTTGGVFESPVPSDRGSLSWTRMGIDLLDVRSLLLAGEQEVYAGTIAGAWTYKFRAQRWERMPPIPPEVLANEQVLSMLLVGSTPARRMILLGTAGEGLWQKAGDSASPATNWPSALGKASVISLTSFGDLVLAAVNGHGVYYSHSTPPKWALLPRSPKNAARVGFLRDDLLVVARDGSIWLLNDAAEAIK